MIPAKSPNPAGLKVFKANSLIFLEGDPGDEMYIIKKGKIKIMRREGAHTVHLATLGPGSVIGEMSLLDKCPRSATAKTLEETHLIVISQDVYQKTTERIPVWLNSIIKMMVQRLRATLEKKHHHDLARALGSYLFCMMGIQQGKHPTNKEQTNTIPLALLESEMKIMNGLAAGDLKKLNLFLQEKGYIKLEQILGKPSHVAILQPDVLAVYYQYLQGWSKNTPPPEESFNESVQNTLRLLWECAQTKATRSNADWNLGMRAFEMEVEQKKENFKEHAENIDFLAKQNIIQIKDNSVKTEHGHHSHKSLVIATPVMEKCLLTLKELKNFRYTIVHYVNAHS
jgi:CRP/FNR family transcriptional regulator, cyclic AMP receptor protein